MYNSKVDGLRKSIRKSIREFYRDHLSGNLQLIDRRVFINRLSPVSDVKLPILCIYTLTDTPKPRVSGQTFYTRTLEMNFEVLVNDKEDTIDEELDLNWEEIENVILSLPDPFTITVNDEPKKVKFIDIGTLEYRFVDNGKTRFGSGVCKVTVEYTKDFVEENFDDKPFKSIHVEYETGGNNNVAEAEDIINLQQ